MTTQNATPKPFRSYAFALDLHDDPTLIAAYDRYHRAVWPEILESIRASGILDMRIYRYGNRLFMLMEVDTDFSFDRKADMDATNSRVQDWERLMWDYQVAVPGAKPGEKWVLMEEIFHLGKQYI